MLLLPLLLLLLIIIIIIVIAIIISSIVVFIAINGNLAIPRENAPRVNSARAPFPSAPSVAVRTLLRRLGWARGKSSGSEGYVFTYYHY